MSKIHIPAARIQQGSLVLYSTALKVKELMSENFYNVETLDPADGNDKGYQRLLNIARAKKLADYIIKGQDSQDAFLPTSIFLATDKSIEFNDDNHTIEFDTSVIGPFSVVDGQHRLEGLKMAAQKDDRVLDLEVPVNIAINLPTIAQMCHFRSSTLLKRAWTSLLSSKSSQGSPMHWMSRRTCPAFRNGYFEQFRKGK